MYIPNEYYKVLELIYDNASLLTDNEVSNNFCHEYGYKPGRFQQIINELVDKGLIVISADYDDGTKRPIEHAHGKGPFETTFDGSSCVESRRKKNHDFWIPIYISSVISAISIIVSVVISFMN